MQRGDLVDGRFEIERHASQGAMGNVYRARDRQSGATVALKLISGANVERFRREARLLQQLDDPGVVRYVAHGVIGDAAYLVMEWLEGEDLKTRLARGVLEPSEAVRVVIGAARGLAAAHARGIIHRDIKPANLWLAGADVKVLDFGIARTDVSLGTAPPANDGETLTHQTATGAVVGTPAYMSPEQVRGSAVDSRADVYSLGCVLFRCITGRTPFVADELVALLAKTLLEDPPRLRDLAPEVSDALDEAVASMLAKDADDRPPDASAVVELLEHGPPRPSIPAGSLTKNERRLASVILLRPPRGSTELLRIGDAFGARVERMIDGTAVVLLEGRGTPKDEALRAASCALALRDALGVETIAVATGRAELGAVPIGEAVERAAGLLSMGPGIRVADITATLLREDFDTHDGVLGERRRGEHAPTLLGKPTVTVGREPELGQLEGLFAECLDETRARAALVTGPAGIGKSRVRIELLRRFHARSAATEVWLARADSVGAGSAFGLAARIVRQIAGIREGESNDKRRDKLRARVEAHVPAADAPRVMRFLGEMIGAPWPDEDDVVLQNARGDARVMFDQIRMAWVDFVGAECPRDDGHGLVIALEDLHWGDRPTVALCEDALRLCADRPLFVIAFARPEVDEQFPGLFRDHDLVRVPLRELSKQAARRLVVSALGDETPERVARIVERAAGNAFYLEELVRAAVEGRSDTPETALLVVQSRLQQMEDDARRVLRAASIFGRAFWQDGVSALVGDAAVATRWLRVLEEREVVQRREASRLAGTGELVFRHALVQEAAYAMLTEADERLGHELAARWLEGAGESDATSLAEHWERSGDAARASATWRRAAEQALDGNDYVGCVTRARRAIARGAEGTALAKLELLIAKAFSWRGDHAEASEHAKLAMERASVGSDTWAEAGAIVAMGHRFLGQRADLSALAHQVKALLPERTRALFELGARIADYMLLTGERAPAEEMLSAIEGARGDESDPRTTAWIEHARALNALFSGRSAAFVTHYRAALDAHLVAGDIRSACGARGNLGFGLLDMGVFDEAERTLRDGLVEARRLGLANFEASCKHNLGWALYRLGRLDEARELELAALAYFTTPGHARMEAATRKYLAAILLARGDVADAEREARIAATAGETASRSVWATACAVIATIMLRDGRTSEALETAHEAFAWVDAHGVDEGEGNVRLVHAEALEACGRHEEAKRAIASARDRLLERAGAIDREDWKRRFIDDIAEHARTMALAREWLA